MSKRVINKNTQSTPRSQRIRQALNKKSKEKKSEPKYQQTQQKKKDNKKQKNTKKIQNAFDKLQNNLQVPALLSKSKIKKQVSINSQNFVICKSTHFENDYEIVDKLGQGSFGSVYRVKHKSLNLIRALKKIKKNPNSQFSSFDQIQILKKLDHSNILKIYQFYESDDCYMIVTDIFQGRELFDEIIDSDKFSQQIASRIIREVLITLKYTHSLGIAHRDVKPQNILVRNINDKNNMKIKIIDWGLGTLIKQQFSDRVCGTPQYAAPQIFQGKYSLLCDMWSLGVLTFVMLTGNMPFKGTNTQQTISQVKRSIINYRKSGFNNLSPMAKQFITNLIQKDPTKRMSSEKALQHPWISQYKQSKQQPQNLKQTLIRLKQLNIGNHFGIAVVNLLNNHFSNSQQKDKLDDIFRFLDTNGDGVLQISQLIEGYSKIYGKTAAQQIAKQTFNKLDVNNSGTLQYSQFIAFGLKRQKEKQKQKLKQAFDMFDLDKSGTISWKQVGKILQGKLDGLYEPQVKQILSDVHQNKDEQLSFQQFYQYMGSILQKLDVLRQSKRRQSQLNSQMSQRPVQNKINIDLKRTDSIDQPIAEIKTQKKQQVNNSQVQKQKKKRKK